MAFLKELYRSVDPTIDNENRDPSDTEGGSTEDDRDSQATPYTDSDEDDPTYEDFRTFRKELQRQKEETERDAQQEQGAHEGGPQQAQGAEEQVEPVLPQAQPTPPAPPNSPLHQPLALRSGHQRLEAPQPRARGRGRGRKKQNSV